MAATELHLPGGVCIAPDTEELFEHMGRALMASAFRAVDERGAFHLALSGGGTPEPFYMRLMVDPLFRGIPWQQTHLWIVDERRVPPTDDKSNWKMIRECLADHVPMSARQKHPMPVMDRDPAEAYEAELAEVFELAGGPGVGSIPRMDVVLLGMGGDAHTASLFPESDAIGVADRWIVVNAGPSVTPPDRVTMTYPLINAAREVMPLVVGGGKAATIRRISDQLATGEVDRVLLPITGVDPQRFVPAGLDGEPGTMTWFMDKAAAGG
ncbi:6-phosphogluconolactonase [Mucisphaera calidilacus]|uniref:6-phosphogluconolactonase n=1 Tax=Mucisphaera calidilacus TaxID=2527982 RepID=A0A518BYN8_9BACT|nr:6-phosphogluconolactonase [Mucisphaera calidilacus]QDU72085.1 6-phosphogluconolactonase [Mucisphaera calidilacus]